MKYWNHCRCKCTKLTQEAIKLDAKCDICRKNKEKDILQMSIHKYYFENNFTKVYFERRFKCPKCKIAFSALLKVDILSIFK